MACHIYVAVVTDGLYPRPADAFPALATEIAELLRAEGEPLAEVVADLPYYGPCTCSATCVNLLTAPPGSSGFQAATAGRSGRSEYATSTSAVSSSSSSTRRVACGSRAKLAK